MANFNGTGYRVFDGLDIEGSVHWRHAQHWMVDVATRANRGGPTGGAMLSPNQSFRFQNGKLIVEADVAARHPDYGDAWAEIDISTGSQPTQRRRDGLYGYDWFPGNYTLGCRFQRDSAVICSLFDNSSGDRPGGGRMWEMSWFQHVGSDVFGGQSFVDNGEFFRACARGQGDAACRDRIRLELTSTSLTVYVNGKLYFRQTGVPALPSGFVNGNLHVYYSSMVSGFKGDAVRFHWDRLAVNPTTGPSVSDTFTG